jgi:hypothetical protein
MYLRGRLARAAAATLMFPLCFIGVTFATQMPILIVLNQQTQVTLLSYVAASLGIGLGIAVVGLTLRVLPFRSSSAAADLVPPSGRTTGV